MCKHCYKLDGKASKVLYFKCSKCGAKGIMSAGLKYWLTSAYGAQDFYKLFVPTT